MEEIFEQNPQLKVVYVTSDGTPFYQPDDARNHAKTLDDKTVETVHNKAHLELIDEVDESEEAKQMLEFEASQTPVVETPVVETPVVETPVVETPVVETPVVETPVVETPVEESTVVTTEKSGTVDLADLTKANLNAFATLNELTIADPKATNAKLIEEITLQLNTKKVQ